MGEVRDIATVCEYKDCLCWLFGGDCAIEHQEGGLHRIIDGGVVILCDERCEQVEIRQ